MPIYEYKCEKCETKFEELIRTGDEELNLSCPKEGCKSKSFEKLMSAANFVTGCSNVQPSDQQMPQLMLKSNDPNTQIIGIQPVKATLHLPEGPQEHTINLLTLEKNPSSESSSDSQSSNDSKDSSTASKKKKEDLN